MDVCQITVRLIIAVLLLVTVVFFLVSLRE